VNHEKAKAQFPKSFPIIPCQTATQSFPTSQMSKETSKPSQGPGPVQTPVCSGPCESPQCIGHVYTCFSLLQFRVIWILHDIHTIDAGMICLHGEKSNFICSFRCIGDDKVKSLGPDMFLDFVLHYETFRDQLPSLLESRPFAVMDRTRAFNLCCINCSWTHTIV
jgi:hypothetical protein